MRHCTLAYIPDYLCWGNQPMISEFFVGDQLFRRANESEIDNPYQAISLVDLSHNLGKHNNQQLSVPEDVLFSIKEDEAFEKYEDKIPVAIEIKDLLPTHTYRKEFEQIKNGERHVGKIELKHAPENCMYPHCVFQIFLDEVEVTFKNYKETLKKFNQIRTSMREEFASMLIRHELSQKDRPA